MTMDTATRNALERETRRRIGRSCWFIHPDTGAILKGVYRKGRKVECLTGMTIERNPDASAQAGRTYNLESVVYTVPRSVRIHFTAPPSKTRAVTTP